MLQTQAQNLWGNLYIICIFLQETYVHLCVGSLFLGRKKSQHTHHLELSNHREKRGIFSLTNTQKISPQSTLPEVLVARVKKEEWTTSLKTSMYVENQYSYLGRYRQPS